MKAAELLKTDHPLHRAFKSWVKKRAALHGGGEPDTHAKPGPLELTRRKARRFLSQYPQYRQGVTEAA